MGEPAAAVLVHGGFLGPWIWEDVQGLLRDQGVHSVAPSLASMERAGVGFSEDVAAVQEVLAQVGPAVICAHSYAGMVVTEAAAGSSFAVHHLVYLAAAVPDESQDMQSLA